MPTLVNEQYEAEKVIYSTLAADATIQAGVGGASSPRIYAREAPPNTSGAYILFRQQSPGVDVRASGRAGAGRIMATPLYLIEAIGQETSYSSLAALALRIDQLFEGLRGANATISYAVQREMPWQLTELDGPTQRWLRIGGFYRWYITSAT